ncbi:MAG: SUF system NifU family Fe-S cluster assembly protein [Bacilli bacterium]|nr:SUF system NifU family Fe-S cluster assembly protein [Bacilli bacterium]MBN2877336.1 SUF system NifU family Fe-S cluster assembly protein [Bacilli bacterium]
MSGLDNLYREVIMEHYKNPRNKGLVEDSTYKTFRIKNPSCGDDITIQSLVVDGIIKDCRQEGHGCSISMASASVLTEIMIGKTVAEALTVAENYLNMVSNKEYDEALDLEEAEVFSGVRQFPARVKCASIAWVAFKDTLK